MSAIGGRVNRGYGKRKTISPGGHLAGRLAGYETRFDFVPFLFRILLVTVIFGVSGFVLAVCLGAFLSHSLFVTPAVELTALGLAVCASQLLYRYGLTSYFRTAELA